MLTITRKLIAGMVALSMLAACAPTAQDPTHRQWIISPTPAAFDGPSPSSSTQDAQHQHGAAAAPRQVKASIDASAPTEIAPAQPDVPRGQNGDARDFLSSQAQGLVQGAAQDWLAQFGTTRLSVGSIGRGNAITGALDMLFPLYDTPRHMIFTQLGVRSSSMYTDSLRTTANIGLGYRRFIGDEHMVGLNAFMDQDLTVGHQRLGLGAEYWTDYFKLGANGYLPLTDWKSSPDIERYLEKPAAGFDLRAEGYLPAYPALGGRLMYEQYFGHEVGLFGPSNRQSDPRAWTIGLTYTPFPALTLGIDHKVGEGGLRNTSASLNLKYQLGTPWSKQFDSTQVAASRKLESVRYDLVERNNEIVLEYQRDEDQQSVALPDAIAGYPGGKLGFAVTIKGMPAGAPVVWSGTAAAFADPYIPGSSAGTLTLPAYDASGANAYQLVATTTGPAGQALTSNAMTVLVQPVAVTVKASKAQAMADGTDTVEFVATLRGAKGEPMVKHPVTWSIPADVHLVSKDDQTDDAGLASATINSINAVSAIVTATDAFGFKGQADTEFLGDPSTARVVSLVANPTSILANNIDTAILTATVADEFGHPVGAGIEVKFYNDGLYKTAVTDSDSTAHVTSRPSKAKGPDTYMATVGLPDDPGKIATLNRIVDVSGALVKTLVASPTSILANGSDTSTLTATVTDFWGHLVGPGVTVTFSGDVTGSGTTDAASQATITAPARTAPGAASITAKASSIDAGKTATVTYGLDTSGAKVDSLVADPASILANGSDTSVLTATVSDAFGNPVGAGVAVSFSGDVTGSGTTDAASQATITAPARTTPGTASITAKASAGDPGKSATVTYGLDTSDAKVVSLVADPASILANGSDTSTLTATVSDAWGNPVGAGVAVSFSGDVTGSGTTDAASQATITAPARTVPGTASVTAKASAGDPGKTVSVVFKPLVEEQYSGHSRSGAYVYYTFWDIDGFEWGEMAFRWNGVVISSKTVSNEDWGSAPLPTFPAGGIVKGGYLYTIGEHKATTEIGCGDGETCYLDTYSVRRQPAN